MHDAQHRNMASAHATSAASVLKPKLHIHSVHRTNSKTVYEQVDGGTQSEVAAIYNLTSNTFTPYHVPQLAEASGHILLPDGRGLIIGGVLPCFCLIAALPDHP